MLFCIQTVVYKEWRNLKFPLSESMYIGNIATKVSGDSNIEVQSTMVRISLRKVDLLFSLE